MRTTRIIRRGTLVYGLLLALAGCDSSDNSRPGPGPTPKPPFTLELSVPEATSVTLKVTPDDPALPYWVGPMTEAEYAACEGDVAAHVATIIRRAQQADPALPVGEIVARLQRTGTVQETYTGLTPETTCYVSAIGLDDHGVCTTPAAIRAFTTPARVIPDGRFTVAVSDIGQMEATVAVTPEPETMPYYFDIVTADNYRACGGDLTIIMGELLAFIREQNPDRPIEQITAALQSLGPDSERIGNLTPSTDFYAFAIGLGDDGTCLTTASVTPFRTLDPGDPAACTFRIAVTHRDNRSVMVRVTPSDGTVGYFTLVLEASEFAGDANLTARIQQAIRQVADEQSMSVEEAVEALCRRGTSEEMQDALTPSTDYYAIAYALRADASAAGPVTKERFTTLGQNTSAAACTVACDHYFDGDALCALDPARYANLAGRVYVHVTAQPSDDALHWYTALGRGDMTDPVLFPDETTINALLQGGTPDKLQMHYVADWGDATLLAVAADAAYQFGTVFRSYLTFTREGASPVEALEPSGMADAELSGIRGRPAPLTETRMLTTVSERVRTALRQPPATFRPLPRP